MEKLTDYYWKIKKFLLADKTQLSLFIAIFLLLFYNLAFFVGKNTFDMPFWDEWDVTTEITQENNWFKILINQHNEHRIGVGLAVAKIAAYFTNWSQIFEVKIISFQLLLACLAILFILKKIKGKIGFLDLIIPFIFFNTLQNGNILFPFQLTFVFPLVFLCLGLASLFIKNIKISNSLVVLFSLLGTFSSFHGLFIPLIFIAFFVLEFLKDRSQNLKIFLSTILAEILIIVAYFVGYKSQFQASLSFDFGERFFNFLATFVSSGFFFMDTSGKWLFFQYLILLATLAFGLLGAIQFFRQPGRKIGLPIIGSLLIAYALLFSLSITIGRSSFGLFQATTTRYLTFTMLIPVGIFLIISNFPRFRNTLKILLFLFLFLNILIFYPNDNKFVERETKKLQEASRCYLDKKLEPEKCFQIAPLYPNQDRLEMFLPSVLKFKKGQ